MRTTNEEYTIDILYMFAIFQYSLWLPVMLKVIQIFITKDRIPTHCLEWTKNVDNVKTIVSYLTYE